MSAEDRIAGANGRLGAARVGVAIEAIGERLYLRATLPPKPGSKRTHCHQQRIALGLRFNLNGVKLAEAEARRVGLLLADEQFDWTPYLKSPQASKPTPVRVSVGEWLECFEVNYFARRARTARSETTWRTDYLAVLKRLPADQLLTPESLIAAVLATEPDTKTRRRTCMALSALAKFAGLPVDFKPLQGSYSPKQVTPRDLPTDELIAQWWGRIKDPAWRWAYGVLACYGLRPHELFHLDTSGLQDGSGILQVLDGKTGARRVWPCYPEWVEAFELRVVRLPETATASNRDLGNRAGKHFQRTVKLPFHLYDLRHCWAVRTLQFGLDISLAAQQMGHSISIHSQTYHAWISDRHHQRAFEALMARPDRPRAPRP